MTSLLCLTEAARPNEKEKRQKPSGEVRLHQRLRLDNQSKVSPVLARVLTPARPMVLLVRNKDGRICGTVLLSPWSGDQDSTQAAGLCVMVKDVPLITLIREAWGFRAHTQQGLLPRAG